MVRSNFSDAVPAMVLVSRTMAFLKDPKYVEMLCEIASKYREPAVRWLALNSLQDRKATGAGDTLQKVLKEDADWIVRKKAAEVLGGCESEMALLLIYFARRRLAIRMNCSAVKPFML